MSEVQLDDSSRATNSPQQPQEQSDHTSDVASNSNHPKLPPCDQCRRRKVKCTQTSEGSCDRCVQSALNCTREIQRKKRGPKKGSGSVIAKLRGETEQARVQEAGLPPFDLRSLNMQLPGMSNRALSNESVESSPLASPIGTHFSDYGPASEHLEVPRSVPLGLGSGISPLPNSSFTHGGINFPSAWQITDEQPLLQYPSPTSANGFVSVSDLAQQIFQEPVDMDGAALYDSPSAVAASINRPNSIDELLTGSVPTTAASPSATTASSPRPLHGPKFLYRSNSGPSAAEPRLTALAAETGISAYLMSQCIKQWFKHLYPIQPVLHEPTFKQMLNQVEELTPQDKILVLSLCALTVTHAAPPSDLTLQNKQALSREFLRQCLHFRHIFEWIEMSTLTTIVSSFFICITYFELKQVRSHHFYLREAIGLAREMMGDSEKITSDPIEIICRKRMLALLFITERGCAILRNKPISMLHLPTVPDDYFDPDDELVVAGFSALCNLFSLLDEKFVELWYASSPDYEPNFTPLENVQAIQHDLNDLSIDTTKMTEIQAADVSITHQWLRLIFWQASMRQGLITTHSTDKVFLYNYPIVIARDLCTLMQSMQFSSILVHGLGIFEKVFEVAYTLMDALTLAKIDWSTSDELRFLFSCLSASPNSQSTYVKVLENKLNIEKSAASSPLGPLS